MACFKIYLLIFMPCFNLFYFKKKKRNNVISPVDAELVKEEEVGSEDSEVVMSMLDTTMPGTLTKEKKKKVMLRVVSSMKFSS